MEITEVMDPRKIGYVAVGVVLTLLTMSVLSVTVFVERVWVLRRTRRVSRECSLQVVAHLRAGRLDPALETARQAAKAGGHLGPVLAAALAEWRRRRATTEPEDAREAALHAGRQAVTELDDLLRKGLPTLATIASTAPFVGLFGTTFGIMNAFGAMGEAGNGGIAAISAGISEALITTAFGLFVAIPALWAHNSLADRAGRLERDAERAARELTDGLVEVG